MSKDPRDTVNGIHLQTDHCPSCNREVVKDQAECFSCGIVFSSYDKFQFEKDMKAKVGGIDHLSVTNIKTLEKMWKKVVVNYHDKVEHQSFLQHCFKEKALPYAVHFYSRMLEIDAHDDIDVDCRDRQTSQLNIGISSWTTATSGVSL